MKVSRWMISVVLGACLVGGVGCGDEEAKSAPGWQMKMDLDIRMSAQVALSGAGATPDFSVQFPAEVGVVEVGSGWKARGHAEAFPEASMTLWTAKFDGKGVAGGPCGNGPVSLALSLARRDGSPRVGGSVTAYCGANKWYGVPVRVWRLSGYLPQ